jgi:hypothetical protein
MSVPDRRAMLDRKPGKLSIRRQCQLLGIARSGVYRPPRAANDNDLGLMRRIDELFTQWPFLGSRRLRKMLRDEGAPDQPQARAAVDAPDGHCGAGPQAAHEQACARRARGRNVGRCDHVKRPNP